MNAKKQVLHPVPFISGIQDRVSLRKLLHVTRKAQLLAKRIMIHEEHCSFIKRSTLYRWSFDNTAYSICHTRPFKRLQVVSWNSDVHRSITSCNLRCSQVGNPGPRVSLTAEKSHVQLDSHSFQLECVRINFRKLLWFIKFAPFAKIGRCESPHVNHLTWISKLWPLHR